MGKRASRWTGSQGGKQVVRQASMRVGELTGGQVAVSCSDQVLLSRCGAYECNFLLFDSLQGTDRTPFSGRSFPSSPLPILFRPPCLSSSPLPPLPSPPLSSPAFRFRRQRFPPQPPIFSRDGDTNLNELAVSEREEVGVTRTAFGGGRGQGA